MTRMDLLGKLFEIYPYMGVRNIDRIITIVFGKIVETLQDDGRVELRGFGAFSTKTRPEVMGRNPKTGEKVKVKERKVVMFKAGKQLKDLINGNLSLENRHEKN